MAGNGKKGTNGELLIRIDERLKTMQIDLVAVKKVCAKIPTLELNQNNHLHWHENMNNRIWGLFAAAFGSIVLLAVKILMG